MILARSITCPKIMLRPALFLDRDGVLNVDHGYVHRWEDFQWVDGAREAIGAFKRAGASGVITYFAERAAQLLGK